MNKKLGWLLAFVVALVMGVSLGVSAQAATGTDISSHTHGLDAPSGIKESSGGSWIDVDPTADLEAGQSYILNYNWSIDDNTTDFQVKAGDTATVTLPSTAGFSGNIAGTIKAKDGTVLGSILVPNGTNKGTITFTSGIDNVTINRAGTLQFNVSGLKKTDSSGGEGDKPTVLSKMGWADNNTFNDQNQPTKLVWDIAINDPDKKDYGKTVIVDHLGPNQVYAGEPILLVKGAAAPSVEVNGLTVTFTFDNIKEDTEFWYYTTPLIAEGQQGGWFTNEAEMTSANGVSGATGSGGTGVSGDPILANKDFGWGSPDSSGTLNGNTLGNFLFTKKDSQTGKTLPGATYTLKKTSGATMAPVTQTTDAQGQIKIMGLSAGDYTLTETKAPEKYDLNSNPVTFSVTGNETTTITREQTDELTPVTPKLGSATLTKRDAQTREVLKGAVYNLLDSNYQTVQANLITGSDGQVTVTDLKPGTYYFQEVTRPSNHLLNSVPVRADVTAGNVAMVEQLDAPSSGTTTDSSSSTTETPSESNSSVTSSDTITSSSVNSSSDTTVMSSSSSASSNTDTNSSASSSGIPSMSSSSTSITSSSSNVSSSSYQSSSVPTVSSQPAVTSSATPMLSSASSFNQSIETSSSSQKSQSTPLVTAGGGGSTGTSHATKTSKAVDGGDANGLSRVSQKRHPKAVVTSRQSGSANASGISRLPQTNEQQRVGAFVIGFLILGGTLSYLTTRRH